MIAIIDYGFGNTGSILNMLKKIGYDGIITKDLDAMKRADKLILPGVGSFDHGMQALRNLDLEKPLGEMVLIDKKPILGICLGMQLMTNSSEEGKDKGLGWIDASTIKFQVTSEHERIPHMGWNEVEVMKNSILSQDFDATYRYYFVHSYYIKCHNKADVLLETEYIHRFTSAFQKDNIFGVQFHPEKSHKFGMKLLGNFASMR